MICILSGGTGTPKLLGGFDPADMCIIVNTAEDVSVSGIYVSPDVDTVVYTLAGLIDDTKWYGQKNDTYHCYDMMCALGHTEVLRIGDKDRGLKLFRTVCLNRGMPLSAVTTAILEKLAVKTPVFPMTDDEVTTLISTDEGELLFHQFWIEKRAAVTVTRVTYRGIEHARAVPEALECMQDSDCVLVGPSNPVTSIGPIIAMEEYRRMLREKVVVGISPTIGTGPVSGPTGVLMQGLGYRTDCVGVAALYQDFLDTFIIHPSDAHFSEEIESLGITVHTHDILLDSPQKKEHLAAYVKEVGAYSL
ncbi:MAG: 2-phospho-L-lactate transferase [Theionarchaea archaeon]|nr:2-phospho-L-lactate transferase [Theionarchaea archaeon]